MGNYLKSSIGNPAEGEHKFYLRERIINKIRSKLADNMNLLISAPRRIGKTSILKYLVKNKEDGQVIKYLIVQSVHSAEEFYKRLFKELISDDEIFSYVERLYKQGATTASDFISRVRGVSAGGITIDAESSLNYHELLLEVIDELSKQGKQVILFIDEFPDAVNNIYESVDGGREAAIKFLQEHREIREKYSNSKIQFVYTGSTGLKNVVLKIGEPTLTNDLFEIQVPPFSRDEAKDLIKRLVLGKQLEVKEFELPDQLVDYILDRVEWFLPYYIQIIIDDLFELSLDSGAKLSTESVDKVIQVLVGANSSHSDYFEQWKSRLDKPFSDAQRKFAYALLGAVADAGSISKNEMFDLAQQYQIEDLSFVRNVLLHDGYLVHDESQSKYGFHSVILREWWKQNA